MQSPLTELYSELRGEKKALYLMDNSQLGKFTSKLAKATQEAIKQDCQEVLAELYIWGSHISVLTLPDRKRYALQAVEILRQQSNPILFANSLENLAALNKAIFNDPTIGNIDLVKMAITIRSTEDDYENLLDMAWAQKLLAELIKEEE